MKKKSVCILLIFAAVIVLTYVTGESYYRGISEKAGLDKQEEKIYKLPVRHDRGQPRFPVLAGSI